MTAILLICSLSTAPRDCTVDTALRRFDLPFQPVTCNMLAQEFLAAHEELWDAATEYPAIVCAQGQKV